MGQQGISELRIHYAKGYRVYLKEYNGTIVLLINGGTKTSQPRDIERAKELWSHYKDELKDGN